MGKNLLAQKLAAVNGGADPTNSAVDHATGPPKEPPGALVV